MTVSSSIADTRYAGDGTSVTFALGFTFYAASTVRVSVIVDATGVETVQILTTHYTLTGGSGATGSVTFLTAPASGTTVVIQREEPYSQQTDLGPNDPLPAEVLELSFDKLEMQIQQVKTDADSSPKLPAAFDPSGDPITIGLPVSGQVLVGNDDGDGWTSTSVQEISSDLLPTTSLVTGVANIAELKALTIRPRFVATAGYTTAGVGGGLYAWAAGSTIEADDGFAIACTSGDAGRYLLQNQGQMTTDQWGILNDLSGDQSTRLQAFFDTCLRERMGALVSSAPWRGFYISAISNSGGLFKITTVGAHGFTTGDTVYVQDCRVASSANGTKTVTVVDTTNITLDSSTYIAPTGADHLGTISPESGINCGGHAVYVNGDGTSEGRPIDGIRIEGVALGGTPPNGTTGGSHLYNVHLHCGVGPNYYDVNGNRPDNNSQFVSRGCSLRHLRITGHLALWGVQVAGALEQVRVTPNGVNGTTRGIYAYSCNTLVAIGSRCDNGGASLDGWVLDTCPDALFLACADNRSRVGFQCVQEVRYGYAISNVTDNGSGLIRVATTYAHGLTTGDQRYVIGVEGVTIPTTLQTVTVIDTTTVDLDGSTFAGTYESGGTISTQPNGSRGSNVSGGMTTSAFHLESNYQEAAVLANLSSGTFHVRVLTQENTDWTKPRIRLGHATDVAQKTSQVSLSGDVRGRTGYPVSVAVSNVTDNGSGLIRVTTAKAHGLTTGDQRYVIGVAGVTIPTTIQTLTVVDTVTVDLDGSTFAGAYVSGGSMSELTTGLGPVGVQIDYTDTSTISSDIRISSIETGINISANASEVCISPGASFTSVDIPVQTVNATDTFPGRGFGGVEYRASGAPDTTQPLVSATADREGGLVTVARMANDTTGANYRMRKALGTPTTPLAITSGTPTGSLIGYGYDGVSAYREAGRVRIVADENFDATHAGGRVEMLATTPGTTTAATIMKTSWTTGLQMFGLSLPSVRADGAVGALYTTVANLGTPTAGLRAMVSDSNATLAAGIGGVVVGGGSNITPVYATGSNWRIG